jgi:hypothetical protein
MSDPKRPSGGGARGPDPRKNPAPAVEVPLLLAEGSGRWEKGDFFGAHEKWEAAWHSLRAAQAVEAAEFLHGLIVVAAGFENLRRGKFDGFRRQGAEGIRRMRLHRAGAFELALIDAAAFLEGLTDVYLESASRVRALPDGARAVPPTPSYGRAR